MKTLHGVPLVLSLALVACAPDFRPAARQLGRSLPEARESASEAQPVRERRKTYFDAERTRVRREHQVLILADGSTQADGPDVQYYPDGKIEHEREYARGEPAGQWRSFWPSGKPRMEATYGTAEPAPMRWWHPNGRLSSEGSTVSGTRVGRWTFWHPNGVKSAEGEYVGGERAEGWRYWDEMGQPAKRDPGGRADG